MSSKRIPGGTLDVSDVYQPGDLPPLGYNQWHEWADVQVKAGLRQQRCSQCGKWKFPQEWGQRDPIVCSPCLAVARSRRQS